MIILELIGYLILGAAVIVGAVLALPYWIAKSMNENDKHPENCSCNSCRRIRQKQWTNFSDEKSRKKELRSPNAVWLSTAQLKKDMYVSGKTGTLYRVMEVAPRSYGTAVSLFNPLTGRLSWINVSHANMSKLLWKRSGK